LSSADGAVFSRIQTGGMTRYVPSETNAVSGNPKDGTANPLSLILAGDEAIASAQLMGSNGLLKLSSHACSGPNPGLPPGTANANSYVDYQENFVVRSTTLANGTPVVISLKFAVATAYFASVIQPMPVNSGDAAVAGEADLRFFSDISGSNSAKGTFAAQQVGFAGQTRSESGILASAVADPAKAGDPDADAFAYTIPALVGGSFTLIVNTHIGTTSSSANPVLTDGDGQMALRWGGEVVGGLAEIRTPDNLILFPPIDNANPDQALTDLPPSPRGVPEPTSLSLLALPVIALMRRRHRV